jgi:glycosyltransferase involved in cell wall biosynthesis
MVGGMENQVALQANYLSKLPNVSINVIAAACFGSLFSPSVIFYPLEMNRNRRSPRLLIELIHHIRKFDPDLVHAHGHKAASMLSSIRFFIEKNIKRVATSHGIKRNNKALKPMDAIFAVSEGVRDVLLPLKSIVVYNGIENYTSTQTSKVQLCQELGLNPDKALLLGVGRLVKTKRFEYLIQAAKDLNANILILGDGPEYKNLTAIAGENVTLAGYREDTRAIMLVADLMVICSDRDGFSLALIEALLSKLPVLSTNVPGAKDILPADSIIHDTHAIALHDFIAGHIEKLEHLKESQNTQFDFAEKNLKIEHVAKQTHDRYQTILANESC